jgi:asparagine synthase (glutamine-hydrolysing)
MCGILGQITLSRQHNRELFMDALSLLEHRGPDNTNMKTYAHDTAIINFGHTRLKIIDLSETSNQPFEIDHCSMIFNGEIYNYQALKQELESNGVIFKTSSDTETILQMYLYYGIDQTLEKLHGMFAFAIYDQQKEHIYIARDRIGIKPLYYYQDNETLIFTSEIKAIHKLCKERLTINNNSVANYYYHRHIAEPQTIYNEIHAVKSGEYMTTNLKTMDTDSTQYWQLKKSTTKTEEGDIVDDIEALLHQSIQEHLVSDVPISFALSGGLDSSLLIAMTKEYKNDIVGYTIKRSAQDIDWHYSKKIADYLNVEQRVIEFQSLKTQKEDKRIFEIYDNPLACSSIFSTYLLYKEIGKDFKVCISGDGADEIFGGYKWYQYYFDLTRPSLVTLAHYDRFKYLARHYLKYRHHKGVAKYKRIMLDRFSKQEIEVNLLKSRTNVYEEDMYKEYINEINDIKDLMYVDFFTFLRFGLIRADLSSMAHSVENRVPFLDHRLVEYAYSIDPKLFNKRGILKYLLKKVAERYLPKEYIYRAKKGFSAPVKDILPINDVKAYMQYVFVQWAQHFDRKR